MDGPPRQAATVGQIQEVDLGPDASARNIAMTEAAMRRFGDHNGRYSPAPAPEMTSKPRIGRDGQPQPLPRKKRRGSDDMKRDELVEALLRENKVDLFDLPPSTSKTTANDSAASVPGANSAADDELAERFQREYLEAMASRREIRNKPPPGPTTGPPGSKVSEIAKGPKLGGSRSARAAMHAAEKEKEKARGTGFMPGMSGKR